LPSDQIAPGTRRVRAAEVAEAQGQLESGGGGEQGAVLSARIAAQAGTFGSIRSRVSDTAALDAALDYLIRREHIP
jgi:hypothetical protein